MQGSLASLYICVSHYYLFLLLLPYFFLFKGVDWASIDIIIGNIESTGLMANRMVREVIVPEEETEKYYDEIIDMLEDLIQSIQVPNTAYMFLKAKGIDRVFLPNIGIKHPELRTTLLILIKHLFHHLPTTTVAAIPVNAVDQLVDIFENDDNLGIKAHALDILSMWLPENPNVQVRIIKKKGLDPFYRQIQKLNIAVTSTLLELFNKILKEHIRIRNDVEQRSKADSDKYVLYQRMGLMERVETPTVCNGLLSVFYSIWSSNPSNDVIVPVFDLIKTMKPYCTKLYKGQKRAIKFFETVLERFQGQKVANSFEGYGMNETEIKTLLEDYIRDIKPDSVNDEF